MSSVGDEETVADRIRNVRHAIPPPEGRRTRNAYISRRDFALLFNPPSSEGVVLKWENGRSFPDDGHREQLAKLSRGRYTPADFSRPSTWVMLPGENSPSDLLAGIRESLEELRAAVEEQGRQLEDLRRRANDRRGDA